MTDLNRYRFELGKTYQTQARKPVKIVEQDDVPHHECVKGSDGLWRYNRPGRNDLGRVTGTAYDFSCLDNLLLPAVS